MGVNNFNFDRKFITIGDNFIVGIYGEAKCNNNVAHGADSFVGIELNHINNAELKSNTISHSTINSFSHFTGIFLGSCTNYYASNNTVTGSTTGIDSYSYLIQSSTGTSFCNYADNTNIGIELLTFCNPTNLYSNHMNNHVTGLLLESSCIVGLQNNRQNQWHNNPYNSDGAFFGPINPSGYYAFSQFNIASSVPVQMDPFWPKPVSVSTASTNNGVGTWFYSLGTQNPSCSQGGEFQEPGSPYTYVTDQDKGIANGDYDNEPDETIWTLYWGLYEKLMRTPSLVSEDPVYSSFVSQLANTNIAKIYQVYEGFHSLGDLTEVTAYRAHHEATANQAELISSKLKDYAEATSQQVKATIWGQIQTEIVNFQNFTDSNSSIITNRNNALQVESSALASLLNSMSDVTTIEQNFVDIYTIILAHLGDMDGNFSSDELATIVYVAEQCPYYGGRAVIDARGLVTLAGVQASYHDEDCFIETRESKTKSNANTHNIVSMTYANPVSDRMSYFIKGSKAENIDMVIKNTNGLVVLSQQDLSIQGVINTGTLPSGMYVLEFNVGLTKMVEKLIIQK